MNTHASSGLRLRFCRCVLVQLDPDDAVYAKGQAVVCSGCWDRRGSGGRARCNGCSNPIYGAKRTSRDGCGGDGGMWVLILLYLSSLVSSCRPVVLSSRICLNFSLCTCLHRRSPAAGAAIKALDSHWHSDCLLCATCGDVLPTPFAMDSDGKPHCPKHSEEEAAAAVAAGEAAQKRADDMTAATAAAERMAMEQALRDGTGAGAGAAAAAAAAVGSGEPCAECGEIIDLTRGKMVVADKTFHPKCVKCSKCSKVFGQTDKITMGDTGMVCTDCTNKCFTCGEGLLGAYTKVLGREYHQGCVECRACGAKLDPAAGLCVLLL